MMSNNTQAKIKDKKQISAIWIVPMVAFAIGMWMLFQFISSKGAEVTITMPTAEGISIGKTEIKSLNVKVGVVTDITLSENYDYIEVKAMMNKGTERMLNDQTQFWVVKPRIGSGGASGLDTILSGSYIQILPGNSTTKQLNFTALELPPVTSLSTKGTRVILSHKEAGKLSVGDPVTYQGFTVGRVEKTSFNLEEKQAQYQLFIFEPYNDLLLSGSQFWLTSGIDVKLNADGFNIKLDSLESILSGGVTFGVPDGELAGQPIKDGLVQISLFDSYEQVQEGLYKQNVEFVMEFNESIRGLSSGAPVEYRGIRIGTVLQAPYNLTFSNNDTTGTKIQVLIKIEPDRFFDKNSGIYSTTLENASEQHFKNGLKGQLKNGNLLTGALFIDTEFGEPDPNYQLTQTDGYNIFPTRKGELTILQEQASLLIEKFNALPLNDAVDSMTQSMDSLNKTLVSADKAFKNVNKLLSLDATQNIPQEMQESMQKLQETLEGFNPDSNVYNDLEQALEKFEQIMLELQPILKQVNDKPNSLVFGNDQVDDPTPAKREN
jgi:paraquat-inducible protein B